MERYDFSSHFAEQIVVWRDVDGIWWWDEKKYTRVIIFEDAINEVYEQIIRENKLKRILHV
jgi:hypothetical protein